MWGRELTLLQLTCHSTALLSQKLLLLRLSKGVVEIWTETEGEEVGGGWGRGLPARREAAHTCSLFSGIFTDSCRAGVTISSVSCTGHISEHSCSITVIVNGAS